MYQPKYNKNYRKNKAKEEKIKKARRMYNEGRNTYEISEATGLSEYEVLKVTGQT